MNDLSAAQVIAEEMLPMPGVRPGLILPRAENALAALAAAGWAVVKLPPADEESSSGSVFGELTVYRNDPGGMWMDEGWITYREARALAAALLAAADHAERVS